MELNHDDRQHGDPRHGGLSDSELDTVLSAVDDELLRCVRAAAHANAALLAAMASGARYAGAADISSARRGDGDDMALAVIELRSMARELDRGLCAALAQARDLDNAVNHAHDRQDALTRMRGLDRARHLQRRSARDRTRARAASVAREIGHLRDLEGALKDVVLKAERLIATLTSAGDFGRALRRTCHDFADRTPFPAATPAALTMPASAAAIPRKLIVAVQSKDAIYRTHGNVVRARNLNPIRHLASIQADASGADLSRADLRDLDVLKDVTWTTATIWPDGVAAQVRTISQEIRPGVYKVRGNSEHVPVAC